MNLYFYFYFFNWEQYHESGARYRITFIPLGVLLFLHAVFTDNQPQIIILNILDFILD